jgi:hypothetical protein
MAGRFGKYGDAKRKALIRKRRLRPPAPRQAAKEKFLRGCAQEQKPSWGGKQVKGQVDVVKDVPQLPEGMGFVEC